MQLLQDTLEILQFLNPVRQHIKEGLIPDCSKAMLGGGQAFEDLGFSLPSSQGLNNQSLHLSAQVVKALIGEPLSEEDLLKVRHRPLLTACNSCDMSKVSGTCIHCLCGQQVEALLSGRYSFITLARGGRNHHYGQESTA